MAVALDESTSLLDFSALVSAPSWLLFDLTNADSCVPPGEWDRHESYLQRKAFVNTFNVVNDTAETGIAVLKSFAVCVKGQQKFQWLL